MAGSRSAGVRLGVDVGGTFTDLVALHGSELITAKVPSTPRDQAAGVVASVEAAAGLDPQAVAVFAHGSTVATNALLERRGARVALVTTAGFRDVIEIGRQNRPALYDLARDRPPALVPRALRFTVRERMGPDGEITPLDEDSLAEAAGLVRDAGVDAVAVCLLFAFLHPAHERRVGEALRAALRDEVHVALSSEVLPELREYERTSTTVADSYLTPKLAAYLRSLAAQAERIGLPAPRVMQSSGGVTGIGIAAAHAARCVLSGPAGGVVGAAWVAGRSGYDDLLTFDMGGTSTDVAPVLGGRVQTTTESVIAGVPIKLPMVDIHTVSAGGGSIAWADGGGALRVGPHSAGADPGPAAYGRGGEEPTVTDADLYLGYLADGAELGGEVTLSRARAEQALTGLGARLGLGPHDTARGIVEVADAEMTRALRVISVERGLDPRELTLVAFGGAGAMHACALAEEMGMHRVLVPKAGGVLSALGLAISDLRADEVTPFPAILAGADSAELESTFHDLETRAAATLLGESAPGAGAAGAGAAGAGRGAGRAHSEDEASGAGASGEGGASGAGAPGEGGASGEGASGAGRGADEGARGVASGEGEDPRGGRRVRIVREADLRYRGQSFELTVPAGELGKLSEVFHGKHEQRYGYRMEDEVVELVNLRVTATLPGVRPELREAPAAATPSPARRRMAFDGEWVEADVWDRAGLGAGSEVAGPAVVELAGAGCVVRPGWLGTVDEAGTLVLERERER